MGGARLAAEIARQRPQAALWAPVFFAFGIGAYFALPREPEGWMLAALGFVTAILLATMTRVGPAPRLALLAALLPALGFGASAARSIAVAAPVLPREMTAAVEGRVIGIDRSASNRARVLLDRVVIHGLEPDRTPARVRISLDASTPPEALRPGARLLGQARLSPPGAPAEPGGFDFRRMAWFQGLGAVGYARTPLLETEGSDARGLRQAAFRARMALSGHIQAQVPGQNGAFAAAILTGDRSAIDADVESELRISTLYHLVSISGLHMSLLAAAVFGILRYGLALVPGLALRWPLKKIAAGAALVAGAAYLAISGAEVPTQRAYIMTAAFLVAVLLDRPALTLRAVALAAMIVLVAAPESLTQAGFQMSFAATVALVAAYEGLRDRDWWRTTQTDRRWRFVKPMIGVAMTSLVAGAATAPFSAFHFNLLAQYGLLANLLAVPAMGVVVMPAAVVGLMAAPFGLDWPALTVMGWGIGYVLGVAGFVAGLDGAVAGVPAAPGATLALVGTGGLWLALWVGPGRWAAVAPIAMGLALWAGAERPPLLVAENGRLFGALTPEGRALSTDGGDGFAAASWLENDGDTATQEAAAARLPVEAGRGRLEMTAPGIGTIRYRGSRERSADADALCAEAAVLIAPQWRDAPAGPCLFLGRAAFAADGAMAVWPEAGGFRIVGARSQNRGRPWTRDPARILPELPKTEPARIAAAP